MAARANPLTDRVRRRADAAAASPPPWTTPASDLRVMMNGLARLGYDPDALLDDAGLRDVDFDDPDGRVACDAYGAIIARAQRQRVTPKPLAVAARD